MLALFPACRLTTFPAARRRARIALHMFEFVRERVRYGKIRVFNLLPAQDGFESNHSVVAIVTDDMPFRSTRCRW